MNDKQPLLCFPFKEGEDYYLFVPSNVSIYKVPELYYDIAGLWPAHSIQEIAGKLSPPGDAQAIESVINKLEELTAAPPSAQQEQTAEPPGLKEVHVQVSHICNLDCAYCYAEGGDYGGPAVKMDEKTAALAVDYFIDSLPRGIVGDLSFDGGEPLTNLEIIRYIMDRAESEARGQNKQVSFYIGTNGTLLDKSVHRLAKEKNLGVGVSIDGDEATHDANRKFKNRDGSYQTIARNIESFIQVVGNHNLQARATITRANLNVSQTVKHLLGLGFIHIYLDPVSGTEPQWQLAPAELERINDEFTALADFYADSLLNGNIFIIRNFYLFIKRLHLKKKLYYKCGVGRSGVAITPHGDIYPCYRFTSVRHYRMGGIFDGGIDREFQRQFIDNHVDHRPVCKNCWARYLCGGGCPYHSVYKQGDIAKNDEQECRFLLHLAKLSLQIYIKVKNRAPRFWDHFFQVHK